MKSSKVKLIKQKIAIEERNRFKIAILPMVSNKTNLNLQS